MKTFNKILATLLSLVMLMSILCVGASAAVSGKAGESVSVTLTFADSYGLNGNYTISNTGIFKSYDVVTNPSGSINKADGIVFVFGVVKTSITITLVGELKSDITSGECTFSFTGERAIDDEGGLANVSKSETLKVTAKDTSKPPVTTAPEEKPVTRPTIETEPPAGGGTTRPISPETGNGNTATIDYTELLRQIDIANSLKKEGYTTDSWETMQKALEKAELMKTSSNQQDVDAAAKELKDAIAALKKIDYTKLIAAIDSVNDYIKNDDTADLWNKLFAALGVGKDMLTSGDQAAVDKAAADLVAALEAVRKEMEKPAKEVTVEVPVEVEPTTPYCNIPVHKVWLIIMIVSLIINAVFVVLTVMWFIRRKKDQKDDTPLVDYHIGDDD